MSEDPKPTRNFFDAVANWLAQGGRAGLRKWLAQIFAILGTTFALLQLFFGTLDLANRFAATLLSWLPYLIPATFFGGAVVAVYFLATATSRVQKQRAAAALGIIVIAGGLWGGWTYYQVTRPPKAVIVLVADFEGQEATKGVDWGRRIYERVKGQIAELALDARVEVQRVFEGYNSSEEAQTKGAARKATIVLWGWYDDVGVSPHFELLRKAERFEEKLAAPPQDLTDFDLYVHSGPQEMAYIVAVVLGLIQHAEGDYSAAEALFTTALAKAPESEKLLGLEIPYFYRANARFFANERTSRPLDAIAADLQEAIALKPDFWQAHWNLGLIYTDYCNPTLTLDASLDEAQKVQDLRPADPAAHWLVGRIHARRGEWEQAYAAYRKAVQLDPADVDAQEGLARALDQLGHGAEAKAAYQRALELRTEASKKTNGRAGRNVPLDPAEVQDKLGTAYFNTGEYEKAIAAFEAALLLRPEDPTYLRHLGNAYYWQGKKEQRPSTQLDRAITEYEKARLTAPDDSLLLTVLGGAYQESGRPADALRAYEEAVRAASCDDEALFLLASQYDAMGRSSEAEAAFQRLSELNPRQSAAWQWLATAAFMREDYKGAAELYRKAISADPKGDSADLYYGLASSLYSLGDFQGAEVAYRQTLALVPDDVATLAGWADSLAKLGRTDEAIAAYTKVVELSPDTPVYWVSMGLLYEGAKRLPEAATAYEKAAALQPEDAMVQGALGRAQMAQGKLAEAVAAYELASRLEPTNVAYMESLAIGYSGLGRAVDALRAAEETLKLDPNDAVAYLVRGGVREYRGEVAQAREDYGRALDLAGQNDGLRQLAEAALKRLSP